MKQISRSFGWLLAACTVALTASLDLRAAPAKPNIVIMVADDLGYADVTFNGGKVIATPNLQRLASTGINLTDFRACPMCSPTRAGLLTGRWPSRFGMMRSVVPPWSKFGLPSEEKTIPELLSSAGYEQRAILGKWHLGHARQKFLPLQNGFTHFYGHYNGAIDYFSHERDGETDWHRNEKTVDENGYATDLLAAEASRFIRSASKEKPWFLYVPFNAPHSPFQAKPEDLKKYESIPEPDRRTYAAMVDSLDQGVGKILAAIEERPDSNNTMVLFFSDNGGLKKVGSNGSFRGEKLTVYEGGTRVCAAIRWPAAGLVGGRKFGERIGYIDVLPTLLASAGQEIPTNVDGVNFVPALQGNSSIPERPWFSYMHQNKEAHASVHLGKWKLVAHGDVFASNPPGAPQIELYNLASDPAESKNVAGANAEIVAQLRKHLGEFGKSSKAGVEAYDEGRKGFKAPKNWNIRE